MKKGRAAKGFSDEEREAVRERAQELGAGRAGGEDAVLEKIAGMQEPDRTMAKKFHGIVRASAPGLVPRLWYGMPAYADRDGKVVCFFQGSHKFKTRYSTLGFSDRAGLDEGSMWPTSFALKKLTPAEESRIAGLLKRATS